MLLLVFVSKRGGNPTVDDPEANPVSPVIVSVDIDIDATTRFPSRVTAVPLDQLAVKEEGSGVDDDGNDDDKVGGGRNLLYLFCAIAIWMMQLFKVIWTTWQF